MLHLVRHSPYATYHLHQCLERTSIGDHVLLLAEAVLAVNDALWLQRFAQCHGHIYCLQTDLDARGLNVDSTVKRIDLPQWVALVAQHGNPLSW